MIDPAIKYGGGPEGTRNSLLELSRTLMSYENLEATVGRRLERFPGGRRLTGEQEELDSIRNEILQSHEEMLARLKREEGSER